jgi:hypothetical protein
MSNYIAIKMSIKLLKKGFGIIGTLIFSNLNDGLNQIFRAFFHKLEISSTPLPFA